MSRLTSNEKKIHRKDTKQKVRQRMSKSTNRVPMYHQTERKQKNVKNIVQMRRFTEYGKNTKKGYQNKG